jgi:hypothetical protein
MIMLSVQPYEIISNNQEVIVKLNRSLIEQEKLERLLDYLFIKSLQQKSGLSETDADQLIDEIDSAVWKRQKSLFEV